MKKIIDISWPILPDITTYKDKQPMSFEHLMTFEKGNARLSALHCSSHTGTHIDAPAHFLQDGKTIDQMPLDSCIGPCKVLDLTGISDKISTDDLQQHDITAGDIILLKTKNSSLSPTDPFDYEFIYLDISGAQYLTDKNIKAVGIDYLGIERDQPGHETHTTLLQKDISIIEGLRLAHVQAGNYQLYCLPLAVVGMEAGLARAILLPLE